MTDEKDISPMVQKVLDNVENQDYDKDQLMNLYNNATNYEKISDFERETLTEKLVAKLKTKYPSQSARMFGNKSTVAQETLTQILEDIKGEFDWITNNQVKPHVKVGGSMVGGRDYVSWYISYRNLVGINASLCFRQKTPEEEPTLDIHVRDTKESKSIYTNLYILSSDAIKDFAVQDYKKQLREVIY